MNFNEFGFEDIDSFGSLNIHNFFVHLSVGNIVTVQFGDHPPVTRFQGIQGCAYLCRTLMVSLDKVLHRNFS